MSDTEILVGDVHWEKLKETMPIEKNNPKKSLAIFINERLLLDCKSKKKYNTLLLKNVWLHGARVYEVNS